MRSLNAPGQFNAMSSELPDSASLQVIVLYLLYPTGPSYEGDRPVRALKQIANRLPGRKTFIYIDNSVAGQEVKELAENEFALAGDNTYLEFSGWQKGLDFVRATGLAADVCLFANDTFLHQSTIHRRFVNAAALRCALKYNAMVGKRMIPPVAGEIFGNPLIPYIRTHLFMLPFPVLEALGTVLSLDARTIDELLLRSYEPEVPLFRAEAPMSKSIRNFVTSHLHSSWYRKMPYTAENFDKLRAKAISIVNSFLLAVRIFQLGYPLISYAKASAALSEEKTPEQLSGEWCGQTELRGKESAVVPSGATSFWGNDAPIYRNVPEKMRSFTLENILDFLERRSHPEHL
jgi:hypothetical protein